MSFDVFNIISVHGAEANSRSSTRAREAISAYRATPSEPRSLLSIARSNSARSRVCWSICSFVRIAQTCFGLRGGFAPVSLRLFHGIRFAEVIKFSVSCMIRTPLLLTEGACATIARVGFCDRKRGLLSAERQTLRSDEFRGHRQFRRANGGRQLELVCHA